MSGCARPTARARRKRAYPRAGRRLARRLAPFVQGRQANRRSARASGRRRARSNTGRSGKPSIPSRPSLVHSGSAVPLASGRGAGDAGEGDPVLEQGAINRSDVAARHQPQPQVHVVVLAQAAVVAAGGEQVGAAGEHPAGSAAGFPGRPLSTYWRSSRRPSLTSSSPSKRVCSSPNRAAQRRCAGGRGPRAAGCGGRRPSSPAGGRRARRPIVTRHSGASRSSASRNLTSSPAPGPRSRPRSPPGRGCARGERSAAAGPLLGGGDRPALASVEPSSTTSQLEVLEALAPDRVERLPAGARPTGRRARRRYPRRQLAPRGRSRSRNPRTTDSTGSRM